VRLRNRAKRILRKKDSVKRRKLTVGPACVKRERGK